MFVIWSFVLLTIFYCEKDTLYFYYSAKFYMITMWKITLFAVIVVFIIKFNQVFFSLSVLIMSRKEIFDFIVYFTWTYKTQHNPIDLLISCDNICVNACAWSDTNIPSSQRPPGRGIVYQHVLLSTSPGTSCTTSYFINLHLDDFI